VVQSDLLDIADPAVGKFKTYEIGSERAERSNEEKQREAIVNLAA
jgi:hypothetical protein